MKKLIFLLPMIVLAACAVDLTEPRFALVRAPSQWNEADRLSFASSGGFDTMCRIYRDGGYMQSGKTIPYSQADIDVLEGEFRKLGLTTRDIELLRQRDRRYGTEQTYQGLICSMGIRPTVNRSFYEGTGHQWQAVFPGRYIYLRGNGEPTGMKVYAWN